MNMIYIVSTDTEYLHLKFIKNILKKKPYSRAMINPSIQDLGRLVRYFVYLTVARQGEVRTSHEPSVRHCTFKQMTRHVINL